VTSPLKAREMVEQTHKKEAEDGADVWLRIFWRLARWPTCGPERGIDDQNRRFWR
jgi:hypothetical protein